jgi:tetratricopeptide (TPR) repeat protein/CheY-like chemotaxis protein
MTAVSFLVKARALPARRGLAALVLGCALTATVAGQEAEQFLREGRCGAALASRSNAAPDAAFARFLGLCYSSGPEANAGQAVRWFRAALEARPESEEIKLLLARALVRAGEQEAAIEHYSVLWRAHPDSAEFARALAEVHHATGRLESAANVLANFLARNPDNAALRVDYARMLSYSRRYADAMSEYEAVLKADPNNLAAQVGVAKVHSWQNHQETALALYDRLLQRHPQLYDALVGKAFALLWLGRQEEARPLLRMAARRNPSDRDVAEALANLGEKAPAVPPIEERARVSGESPPAKHEPPSSDGAPTTTASVLLQRPARKQTQESRAKSLPPLEKPAEEPAPQAKSGITWIQVVPLMLFAAGAAFLYGVRARRVRGELHSAPQPIPLPRVIVVPPIVETRRAEESRTQAMLWGQLLVVDHELDFLSHARRALAGAGASVALASTSQEALTLLGKQRFDGIIAGRTRDGWSSAEVAKAISREFPALISQVLLISPEGGDAAVDNMAAEHKLLRMSTPFAMPDLVAMARLLLNRGKRAGRETAEAAATAVR